MARKSLWARRTAAMLALPALGAGCSLVNSFGDVTPQKEGSDASTLPDVSSPGADAAPDVSADDGEAAAVDAGPRGAIVVGGVAETDAGPQFVLTALDPATGSELPDARQPMTVSAVQYDGAADVWFVFESGGAGIFPLPTDPCFVHAFRLDTTRGDWKELGKLAIPAGLSFATTATLGQRLAYIAYGQGADAAAPDASDGVDGGIPAPFGLVTIDTSDPTAMKISRVVPLAASPSAVVGTRSQVNPAGGVATLGASQGGKAQLTPVLVPALDDPTVLAPITALSAAGGQLGFDAVDLSGGQDVAVVSRGFAATRATVEIYDPGANDPTQALLGWGSFPFGDGNVKPPAYDDCTQTLFVVGTNADLNLYAVSLAPALVPTDDGGAPSLPYASVPTGHSGQGVYYEPFTRTVLVPFSQGENFALTAFQLSTSAGAPQLVLREAPRWVPPKDLRPNFIATRTPYPATCRAGGDE